MYENKRLLQQIQYFGIVVVSEDNTYFYSDLLDTAMNSYINMLKYSGRKIYWKLDDYKITRVHFDSERVGKKLQTNARRVLGSCLVSR